MSTDIDDIHRELQAGRDITATQALIYAQRHVTAERIRVLKIAAGLMSTSAYVQFENAVKCGATSAFSA